MNGKTEEAYNLLSDNCKQAEYPSINVFIDGYYSNNFAKKQTYNYQVWDKNTYKIELRDDILTSGIYYEDVYVEDYYTIGQGGLNINGYIKRESIDNTVEKNNVKVELKTIDYYKKYTICTVQVTNQTDETIKLDTRENPETIYLVDKNGVQYNSLNYENYEEDFIIEKGETKTITIKINAAYMSNLNVQSLNFTKVILNSNNEEESRKMEIEIGTK